MKRNFLFRTLSFTLCISFFWSCNSVDDIQEILEPGYLLGPEAGYFLDISFGNEFGEDYKRLRKWEQDINIYLPDTTYPELMDEFRAIASEINSLSQSIQIRQVEKRSLSNYIIYFGDGETYAQTIEPNASRYIENNYGLFYIYWTNFRMHKGSMYVDVERTQEVNCQKHLLREELTQSLGLMNDTYDYPESIFYQSWTCGPRYADIDRTLIQYMLSEELKAGMSKQEVYDIIKDWR